MFGKVHEALYKIANDDPFLLRVNIAAGMLKFFNRQHTFALLLLTLGAMTANL